ncbi:MAG: xanthine dehydrogenase family protein subunit M [Desulfarculus sp.]|nr:xanthine dehydrogenase family protein subunit M [Desulfarculus sp.]
MATSHFALHQPQSLSQALDLLEMHRASVRLLAGGTDLVPKLKVGALKVANLVSLQGVPGLGAVAFDEGQGLVIGGTARLAQVAALPEVKRLYPGLAHACSVMATTQIRNMGTVAGNLANAAPSADTAAPLLAYDARVTATNKKGSRDIPLAQFFAGPGLSVLEPGEIITAITVPPPPPKSGSAYQRLSARSQVDICAVGVAASLSLDGQGRLAHCRLACASVAPTPLRCLEAEEMLSGQAPGDDLLDRAAQAAAAAAKPIDDMRASAAYRRQMVEVLSRRVLATCLAQAASLAQAQGGAA